MSSEGEKARSTGSKQPLLSNRPFVIGLLFAGTMVFGFTNIVGVVLAYIYQGQEHEEWEASHFRYLITTFWLAFIPAVLSYILLFLLFFAWESPFIVFLIMPVILAIFVHSMVRTVMSMTKSHAHEPMPNPGSWTI